MHLIKLVHLQVYDLFSFNWFLKAIYGNQKQLATYLECILLPFEILSLPQNNFVI